MKKKMPKKKHPLYTTWNGMIARCYYEYHSHYKYYGARGVTVDERWHEFWNFIEDVDKNLPNGYLLYEKGWQLDKDIKGGNIYSLENCVVTTAVENNKLNYEKSQKKIMAYNGIEEIEFVSINSANRELNVSKTSIGSCLKRGNRHKKSGYYFKYAD